MSLYHLVSKILERVPELAALRVACKDPAGIAIADVVALVRSKGEAFNSEKQTQHNVAHMCFAGVANEELVDRSQMHCRSWKKSPVGEACAANGFTKDQLASLASPT